MQDLLLDGTDWKFKEFLGEDWVWRNAHKRNTGDVRFWKPGSVPSAVTNDLYRCGEIPDPYYEKNSLLLEWIPERTWVYRKTFRLPEEMRGKDLKLCFDGIDYEAQIYFNDVLLGEHKGMFTSCAFDVTELAEQEGENLLAVVIQKAPDEQPQVSKTRYVKTHKSRMTYWWDFCPRMIHQGIWDSVFLEAYKHARIRQIRVDTALDEGYNYGSLEISVDLEHRKDCRERIRIECDILQDKEVITVLVQESEEGSGADNIRLTAQIAEPALWWPSEHGDQPLYEIKVRILVSANGESFELSQEKSIVTGIREIRFEKNEGAGPEARPYTLHINGRSIYMKGWNWVPMDVLYGVRRFKKLEHFIRLAKEAHVNIFRVWGGGLIEREEFYRLCDEQGILVWQEFIQSSSGIDNQPPGDLEFLQMMEQQAREIIPRKKHHPSLAIWGGGNELQGENGTMITDREPVIALLKALVEELDKNRYFLISSPTGRVFNNTLEQIAEDPEGLHDVHGPWEHQGLKEQYTLYNAGTSLLSSEFGVEGMTNEPTLLRGMDEKHLWPPDRDNSFYFHRGSWWNNYPLMQTCFGQKITNIKEAVKASQLMQYEGLRYAVEANRRRAMHLSGTFPWQFNEPYPNNTCTSSVDYHGLPKPAYYAVKKAYEPYAVSAEFETQTWSEDEEFSARIYYQATGSFRKAGICAEVTDISGQVLECVRFQAGSGAEKAVCAGKICFPVRKITGGIFFLNLQMCTDDQEFQTENRYLFTKSTLAPLLNLETARVELQVLHTEKKEGAIIQKAELVNHGPVAAVGLKLEDKRKPDEENFLYFSENYLYLFPGEKKMIQIASSGTQVPEFTCEAFNVIKPLELSGACEKMLENEKQARLYHEVAFTDSDEVTCMM